MVKQVVTQCCAAVGWNVVLVVLASERADAYCLRHTPRQRSYSPALPAALRFCWPLVAVIPGDVPE